jgi:hypothetical protein
VTDHLVVGGQLGNYLIDSVIGRGGMSVVYRAKHSRLGMPVALKVLAPELSADDNFRERFLREAQMAAAVDHPSVIPIHDMGVHEHSLYIVMRYVAGGDLKAMLSADGPLEAAAAVALLMPVAQALDAAHTYGLVHRDVKPANILTQRSSGGNVDHVYLTDFGIAKSSSSMTGLTRAGAFIGTVEYMAPEQMEAKDVTSRTDVYSLAATFYECITGQIPFHRELTEGVRPPKGPAESVATFRASLPVALDEVIAKALSHDPLDRYVTCEQFMRACAYACEQAPAAAERAFAATRLSDEDSAPIAALDPEPEPPSLAEQDGEPPPPAEASVELPPPAVPAAAGVDTGANGDNQTGADAGAGGRDRRPIYAGLAALVIAAAVAVVVLGSSSKSTPKGALSTSPLLAVPTNRVTGSGNVEVHLEGNVAVVTVTTKDLDSEASLVHAMHIHAGGKGECPPASAARLHNGHLAISTNDGILYYGPPVLALTTRGDTSVASILAFPRFLTGGDLHYTRTITLPAKIAAEVRANNAVIVVHGIDYDNSGIYSGVLDRSELDKTLPATATAPALCGRLVGQPTSASVGARARSHVAVFNASLGKMATPLNGEFFCHVPATTGPAEETRRQLKATL